ncbi:MAG TPA: dTDP-4-dehydrorhamnose 3,5-epimerase family protein [Bacteroidota bacterium]|nr:dTDP-4-dehydrorhamnose 3,5-epimerase family protein [Bacteroidota bacterium]
MFKHGTIHDVVVRTLPKHIDDRGWLAELFRRDEIAGEFFPAMGYVSMTAEGVTRGPHEHVDQADCFAFIGPSNFKVWLWDNRKDSPAYMTRQIVYAGEDAPRAVIIPPGVVHAYTNIGGKQGMVLNFPNRLYAGEGKKSPVDEIRHETDPQSIFRLE